MKTFNANELEKGIKCKNGLTVKCFLTTTKNNPIAGLIEICPTTKLPPRRILCTKFENAVKVCEILIDDFGGEVE